MCACTLAPVGKPKAFDSTPPSSYYRPHSVLEMNTGGELGRPPILHLWRSNLCPWLWLPAQGANDSTSKRPEEDSDFSEDTEQERETKWKRNKCTQDEPHKGKLNESQGVEFNFSGNGVILLSSESLFILLYFARIISKAQFLIYNYLTT